MHRGQSIPHGVMLISSIHSILVRVKPALTLKHIKAREEEEANAETRNLVGTVCTVKAPPDTQPKVWNDLLPLLLLEVILA